MVNESGAVITSKKIQNELKHNLGIRVSKYHIIKFLRSDLGLTYHKVCQITANHNTIVTKLSRQLAAAEYIRALCRGKVLINVDETILQSTDNRHYTQALPGTKTLQTSSKRMSRVSITAAACSNGKLMFTVSNGTTNSSTFINFLILMVKHLSRLDPWWYTNYLIIVDNAPYHKSSVSLEAIELMNLPILFLGPYQYDLAPVEQVFRCIKQRDLNESRCPVSTKQGTQRCQYLLEGKSQSICSCWRCRYLIWT
ncbi:hypothetical protein OXYTRIMIC_083 [Oxytricha trifallax]|uniref:Tc1-like transposase DDE domain-containing protein n=1 Tax=Oxytricha trifallax TaxID=1172189 RepID=A0A073IBW9_9SPIT|nr:hypothetical protein OXYTRIMIC_083 [Oxytricha trifallax]